MSLGLAFAFFITNMASVSRQFSWHEVGRFKIQLVIFCGVCFISWLVFQLKWGNLVRLFAVFFFVTNPIFQLFVRDSEQSAADDDETGNPLVVLIGSRKPAITPNIYLFVYDAYVGNETMIGYGIDNQPQEEYLKDLDFKLYPQTYSLGSATLSSISQVLMLRTVTMVITNGGRYQVMGWFRIAGGIGLRDIWGVSYGFSISRARPQLRLFIS